MAEQLSEVLTVASRGESLPESAQLDRMAETLVGIGCAASAEVVERLAATARETQFVCETAPRANRALTKDERRQELERLRDTIGGGRRIAEIFDKDLCHDDKVTLIPASFVQAMINQILRREFPGEAE